MTNNQPFDFANILFAGPCNLRCPYCIGRQLDPTLNRDNLSEFPLKNLARFVALIRRHRITEVVFTGTTTDPQLYRHEGRLLAHLREVLPPDVRFSLHTNGRLALQKMDEFNQYQRVTVSFPSFNQATYRKLMGADSPPDLAEIVRRARVPVKVSAVLTPANAGEFDAFLARCRDIGVKRLVYRQLYGQHRRWPMFDRLPQTGSYRDNPIYDFEGMEVTFWDFQRTESRSLNLFSSGVISPNYLLARGVLREEKSVMPLHAASAPDPLQLELDAVGGGGQPQQHKIGRGLGADGVANRADAPADFRR
jgi:MoaA/NifB/PqqE/SkfB family radical SAM enzyme